GGRDKRRRHVRLFDQPGPLAADAVERLIVDGEGRHEPRTNERNSARVTEFLRKDPRVAEVTMRLPGLRTPRCVMQRCSASMTTATPSGLSAYIKASAT